MTKNHLTSSERKDINSDCELLFVKIIMKNQKIITVGSFYRPYWTNEKYIDDFAAAIAKVNPVPGEKNIWIEGHFNLPDIGWSTNSAIPSKSRTAISNSLVDTTKDKHLS